MKFRSDVAYSHPSWYITPSSMKDDAGLGGGTLQARITCKSGSLQTDPPPIQALRCSRFVGGTLLSFDLSQIELRVAALLSGDSTLVTAYQNDLDLHTDRAIEIFTLPFLEGKYGPSFRTVKAFRSATNGERQIAKHVNFADLFRSGPGAMQSVVLEMSGTLYPISFFEDIVARRPRSRPGLWAWQESLIATARRYGRITLPILGQSRYFLNNPRDRSAKYEVNEIVNFPVQATAGNVLLFLQNHILRTLSSLSLTPYIRLILNVYDALYFDVAPTYLPRLLSIISSSVTHLSTFGYWARLSALTGNTVPLSYETKELTT